MWCAECQLDVPALAVPEEPGVIRCAYCHAELAGRQEEREQELGVTAQATGDLRSGTAERGPRLFIAPPPVIDDWHADAELRQVERHVRILAQSHRRGDGEPAAGLSAGHRLPMDHGPPAANPQAANRDAQPQPAGMAAWACLTLGLMAFVCGGVLVVWSFAADRGDLWSLGLPLTLAGQVGLVLGLLLQLDGLSQSSRRTEQTLSDLDGQLGQLRTVTALINSSHSGPAHSFYAHLTEGAAPQILLADLKGQLDLLAQQMARQRRAA